MKSMALSAYLGLKEVWRNRGRYLLVSLVIALITLLVLFIAALGEGLSDGNKQYIAGLDAQLVVFLQKSGYNISASRLEPTKLNAVRRVEGVADAGPISTSSTEIVSVTSPLKVSLLGVTPGHPGMPEILAGRDFRGGDSGEAVIDRNVALRTDIRIGDEIEIRSTQGTADQFFRLRVVGLTGSQSYFF